MNCGVAGGGRAEVDCGVELEVEADGRDGVVNVSRLNGER